MPTVRGILRRGMTVAALREFIIRQGPSKNILNLEWGVFWATNKKYIDPVAPRHTAVVSPQAVHCRVRGLEGPGELVRPKHLKNPGLGSKRVVLSDRIIIEQADAQTLQPGDEVTLMNWGNAFTAMSKKTKKLTWLAAADDNLVPIDIVSFDYLLTKDRLEKDDDPENFLTPVTESREQAFADCNVKDLPKGAVMQFDRKGFFKVDAAYQGPGSKVVFFDVPFGNPG
ncbi:hypothetical protein MGN70_005291 [Eutypa lata]|nr:hypothetical protein MGN70_005291 [Eutypa lata]